MAAVVHSRSSPPPPVYRLPPELLIDIFVHCSDTPSDQLTPVVLAQVCRYWSDVSRLSPRIWQNIHLYESNGTALSHVQAARWMRRSLPLPFDVFIHASTTDMILPLMSPILSQMNRINRCVISGRHEEQFDFSKYPFDPARDCFVDELHLVIKGVSALDVLGLNTPGSDSSADDRASSTIFHVHSPADGPPELALHFSVYAVPLAAAMQPIGIRALSISEFTLDVATDVPRMLAFLRCTPRLESFAFTGWPQEGAPIAPGALGDPVDLPCLRTLLVRSTVAVRALLGHLAAPALQELRLEHTNVDFALRTEPYVAAAPAREPGESEDEARDFSQSPWSDHATGMGLRALVRRSRVVPGPGPEPVLEPAASPFLGLASPLARPLPPALRVLHMDYADMRTKDFRWAFDRLAHLEEFRIVGSDMSDRVIAMLAPYRVRARPSTPRPAGIALSAVREEPDIAATSDSDSDPDSEEDFEDEWAVRLPNLKRLAVWHCQRISGDVLVRALRRRVVFTDRAEEEGRGETLETVTVVGCSEVLFPHAQALSDVLGDRLRLS